MLTVFVLALIALRLCLPALVRDYANRKLARNPDYRGRIDKIGISLWRGTYQIKGLKIEKLDGVPVAFFSCKLIGWAVSTVLLGASVGWSETGVAKIQGTSGESTIAGTVTFTDTKGGLKISARLTGVPRGDHGFHIHEFGNCADDGKAAGGHYNPASTPHGDVVKSGIKKAHGGDLGNILAKADGTATLDVVLPMVTLSSRKFTVGGRAMVLHEKTDDFSQPAGNAGARIGCGVIAITAL